MQAAPMGSQAAAPALSSSSTLWAQASKEWVIPTKPKAGRKPKREVSPSPPLDDDRVEPLVDSTFVNEKDSKSRRVQNRAAQRAFRERKQSQLADLRARIQAYEQGEVERNVALQSVAKRLKEENELLRKENIRLKAELAKRSMDSNISGGDSERKRGRQDGFIGALLDERTPVKKPRTSPDFSHNVIVMPPPSDDSSTDSYDGYQAPYSPLPYDLQPRAQSVFTSQTTLNNNASPPAHSVDSFDNASLTFDCGLCSDNTPCVCRELARQSTAPKVRTMDDRHFMDPHATSDSLSLITSVTSILDNLPPYQPPVRLRRKNEISISPADSTENAPIQRPTASTPALCSGNPSDCPACADDAFGKAFCTALGDSVCSSPACAACPNKHSGGTKSINSTSPMSSAGSAIPYTNIQTISLPLAPSASSSSSQLFDHSSRDSETMPCNEAWRRLKSHPHIAFADLSMLAEVVARRSVCNGPRVLTDSTTGSTTATGLSEISQDARAYGLSSPPSLAQMQSLIRADDTQPILLVDPHAQYYEQQRTRSKSASPPRLVPHDVLVECGKSRVREVEVNGVRDALRLLDAQFGRQ